LAELSTKLNTTYLAYGKEGKEKALNQVAQDANAAKLSVQAAAARCAVKGNALYRNAAWDLVDRCKEDPKFDIKKVPVEELCDELKKLTPDEREKFVKAKLAERETLQKKIAEVNVQREAFVRAEMKKNPSRADKAFDEAVRGALREQAAGKGIDIPK